MKLKKRSVNINSNTTTTAIEITKEVPLPATTTASPYSNRIIVEKNMEWTREKTIALISEYRKRHGLWDMTDDDYRKKEVKHQLLKSVSESLGGDISIQEIEKKFHTLRTQYHREINRMKRKEPYNSKWFGFKYLQFLSSPKACRSTKGRIKAEITEDGTVTTKFIIRDPLSSHDTSGGSSGSGGGGGNDSCSPNDNDEYITLQKVEIDGCNPTTTRTHELEKLIEETTKDVDDIEDNKTKMEEEHQQDDDQGHEHHSEYNGGELQISSVESEQDVHHMEEIDDNIEDGINIQNSTVEDITYHNATSSTPSTTLTASTMIANPSNSTTVHAIPARIIKIQRRDASHENNDFYTATAAADNSLKRQHSHGSQSHSQVGQHRTVHTSTTAKRIFYDANSGQYTAAIATNNPHQHQTSNNSLLLNAATSNASSTPRPPSSSQTKSQSSAVQRRSSKIQIRNNLSSIASSSNSNKSIAMASSTSTSSSMASTRESLMRDDFTTYGEYVANEMRSIHKREILVSLKHKINTALFEANMADLHK